MSDGVVLPLLVRPARRRPSALRRLALRVGIVLVAWARSTPTADERRAGRVLRAEASRRRAARLDSHRDRLAQQHTWSGFPR